MNKLMHTSNNPGQSIADRVIAAKHSLAGSGLAKSVCKATTEEVLGPKKKHLDYLIACTNEPNVSIPQMANLLIERTQHPNWVVVNKALVTIHNLMNYGNERFTQYLASNNCTFNLSGFLDKTGVQGYDMSTYIRRYAKYLNEKCLSYRNMAFDFCKVKRGKDDGLLRTMNTEKLLKTLPALQQQLDALLEFDVTPNELTNGVINACFMLLFKDLIRLFACYNDGIINLLEKYFEIPKKQCREALDIYKKFLVRMDRVSEFLKVAESVGIDKGDIPDLAKAPSSLLEALEEHLKSLEGSKKGREKPASVTAAVNSFAAASQSAANVSQNASMSSAAGSVITDDEKRKILEDEQRELDKMKEHAIREKAGSPSGGPPATSLAPTNPFLSGTPTQVAQPPPQSNLFGAETPKASDDLLALSGPAAAFGDMGPPAGPPQNNPFSTAVPSPWGTSAAPVGTTHPAPSSSSSSSSTNWSASQFATEAEFERAFGNRAAASNGYPGRDVTDHNTHAPPPGLDGFGEILMPQNSQGGPAAQAPASTAPRNVSQAPPQSRVLTGDLDTSLASLAGSLSINPGANQVKKTDHQWTQSQEKKGLTGGGGWQQPPMAPASSFQPTMVMFQRPAWPHAGGAPPPMMPPGGAFAQPGMPPMGSPAAMPGMAPVGPHPTQAPAWATPPQQPSFGAPRPQQPQQNDPFGAL